VELTLLAADVEELRALDLDPTHAARRGIAALGTRPTYSQLREPAETEAGTRELVHLYADTAAEMRGLRYSFATKSREYDRSRRRYDAVDAAMASIQLETAPRLRQRLGVLRARESVLEQRLRGRGIEVDAIGPKVPRGQAIDPTPKPTETRETRATLAPLPPRRGRLARLLAGVRRLP
jgi:hypothetical protein